MNEEGTKVNLYIMYKDMIFRVFRLLFLPKKEWGRIFGSNIDFDKILSAFLLPCLFIVAILVFLLNFSQLDYSGYSKAVLPAVWVLASFIIPVFANQKILLYILNKIGSGSDFSRVSAEGFTTAISSYASFPMLGYVIIAQICSGNTAGYFAWAFCAYVPVQVFIAVKQANVFTSKKTESFFTIISSVLIIILPYLVLKLTHFMQFIQH